MESLIVIDLRALDIVEFCVIYSRPFLEHLEFALARFCFVCCMYEKRDVTYLADTELRINSGFKVAL